MSEIKISPIKKFVRTVKCAADKSISHRALMFNSIAKGDSIVKGLLLGEDCRNTIECMRALGAQITNNGNIAYIKGAKQLCGANLYAGNSGTTMRLLCGLLCGRSGEWTISGDESLSVRPMGRVINPLAEMGAIIRSNGGKAPLKITGGKLHAIDYEMPVASAQVKSAIILAALNAEGTTVIRESEPSRDHTEIMLAHMGADIKCGNGKITLSGGNRLNAVNVEVPADISSAAFPLVLGLITGGTVTALNVGLNPTRTGILEVFDLIGADYSVTDVTNMCGEKVGNITVSGLGQAKPFKITKQMIPRLVDEIPVLGIAACYLGGDSVISGAEELRVKESDRIAATVNMINAFGGCAQESADGMIIRGVGRLKGGCTFNPNFDHRMAMSAAVAAAASERGATVMNHECAAVSYPDFYKLFEGGNL